MFQTLIHKPSKDILKNAFLALVIGIPFSSLCLLFQRLLFFRQNSFGTSVLDVLGVAGFAVIFGVPVVMLIVVPIFYLLKKINLDNIIVAFILALLPASILALMGLILAPIVLLYSLVVASIFSIFAFRT